MATIDFAFFFLTLSTLLAPHHARQLNDGYIYVRFGRRPPLQAAPEVIQMVIGKEELQSPPSYGRDKPKTPPSPRVAPSGGQKTYGGDNPKLAPPEAAYGRDNTKVPPSPEVAPSGGQKTYGGDNPIVAPAPPLPEAAAYGGDNAKVPLSLESVESDQDQGQTGGYGRDKRKAPPPPKVAPSRGEATYGGGNLQGRFNFFGGLLHLY